MAVRGRSAHPSHTAGPYAASTPGSNGVCLIDLLIPDADWYGNGPHSRAHSGIFLRNLLLLPLLRLLRWLGESWTQQLTHTALIAAVRIERSYDNGNFRKKLRYGRASADIQEVAVVP